MADIRAWRDELWLWCRSYRLPPGQARAILVDLALRDLEDFLEANDEEAAEAALSTCELISPQDGTAPIPVGAIVVGDTAVGVRGLVRSYQAHGEPYERMQSPLAQCKECRNIYAVGPPAVRWAESAPATGRSDGFEPGEPWNMRMHLGYEPYTDLSKRRSLYLAWSRLTVDDTAMR